MNFIKNEDVVASEMGTECLLRSRRWGSSGTARRGLRTEASPLWSLLGLQRVPASAFGPTDSSQTWTNQGKSSGGHEGGQSGGLREPGLFSLGEGSSSRVSEQPPLPVGRLLRRWSQVLQCCMVGRWETRGWLNQERFQLEKRKSQWQTAVQGGRLLRLGGLHRIIE